MTIARALAITTSRIHRFVTNKATSPEIDPQLAKRLRSYIESCGVEFLPHGEVRIKRTAAGTPTISSDATGLVAPTSAQVKIARGILGLTQADVAKASGVSRTVIGRSEQRMRTLPYAISALAAHYEAAGVDFLPGGQVHIRQQSE